MTDDEEEIDRTSPDECGQYECLNCGSRRFQFIRIEVTETSYLIHLICMSCGLLQTLTLNNKILNLEMQKTKKKK